MKTKHGTLEVVATATTTKAEVADALDWAGLPEAVPTWLWGRIRSGWCKLAKYLPTSPNATKKACLVLVSGETVTVVQELVWREATNSIVLETAHDL